jgi:hypothetical protein
VSCFSLGIPRAPTASNESVEVEISSSTTAFLARCKMVHLLIPLGDEQHPDVAMVLLACNDNSCFGQLDLDRATRGICLPPST